MPTETATQKVWRELRYGAWCALNDEGTPIAASVRNNPSDVPGIPVECRVVIRKQVEEPVNMVWRVVTEGNDDEQ